MNILKLYALSGIDLLLEILDALRTRTPDQLAAEVGVARKDITQLRWVARFYDTDDVRSAARGHYLGTLTACAVAVRNLKSPTKSREQVLLECLEAARGLTVEQARAKANDIVGVHNEEIPQPPPRRQRVHTQQAADPLGQRRLIGTFNDDSLTRMEKALTPRMEELMREGCTRSEALATAMEEAVTGTLTPAYQPALFLPLRASEGYFKDGKIYTTDGAGIPLSELDGAEIGDTGWVIVAAQDPDTGEIGAEALPIQRFADTAQRLVLATETMICTHPDCDQPAWRCQFHHIVAFSHGGATETPNMLLLCKVHNGRNDDTPGRTKNGRMVRDDAGTPLHHATPSAPGRRQNHRVTWKGWRREMEQFLGDPTL
ncbi:HNH endonuclease [Corynebacterium sp. 153RC1]|uniref:HNH endonuclease signature motif containing protein n=1 Tax=Corynebacterium TaxID=1716 RepID=UPI00211C5CE3|nr:MULTISPECIES: HNH endonuclease signature motif containing protein [unclassified Corynebacterium]MCQ9370589.1 HNH endonuclease [Corynebacterium sp. 35RC1]MCQ9342691.1 HNH endonuclease [Corynebacterium sp. 76QC2CO]MCQ9351756.1 HNH endonuclease [Corynebacterium sp. 209RC1]MCQ9354492.1 HNH endonuclease [Corynebacterium sp. 1222RC1]MCQ9356038.1 HNH endonuclease [Corynebacterium sp. 122RC1]